MVVCELHVMCSVGLPAKNNSPLIVDADAVQPAKFSFERFEPIRRRHVQVIYTGGRIDLRQFSGERSHHFWWYSARPRAGLAVK